MSARRLAVLESQLVPTSAPPQQRPRRRIGVVGFGKIGQFIVNKVLKQQSMRNGTMELAFVCDLATPDAVMKAAHIPEGCKAANLDNFERFGADLIVEVSHPIVSKTYGKRFLASADYMIASTTTFADPETERVLRAAADAPTGRGIYVAVGALFGALDIKKMSDAGQLAKLEITMAKHPESLYPERNTREFGANERAKGQDGPVELYRGPVRHLAEVFPRNVNTLCTAAIAALRTTGMDNTVGVLIADRTLKDMKITVTAEGHKRTTDGRGLAINVSRVNPSSPGEVTGPATLHSFFSSLKRITEMSPAGDGVHLA